MLLPRDTYVCAVHGVIHMLAAAHAAVAVEQIDEAYQDRAAIEGETMARQLMADLGQSGDDNMDVEALRAYLGMAAARVQEILAQT